jgi:hypothetical protein
MPDHNALTDPLPGDVVRVGDAERMVVRDKLPGVWYRRAGAGWVPYQTTLELWRDWARKGEVVKVGGGK